MKIAIIGSYGHQSVARYPGATLVYAKEGTRESLEELLEQERPDLVYIGSVYAWNGSLAVRALELGYSVICEKPLAVDRFTLERMRELTTPETPDRPRIIAEFTMRWFPVYEKARTLVQSGAIGEPVFAQAQKSYKFGTERPEFYKERATFGGIIPWVATHAIDFVSWVAGIPYESVDSAQHGNRRSPDYPEMEDFATLHLSLRGGVPCLITADFLRPAAADSHSDDRLRITGTRGVLEIQGNDLSLINEQGTKRWHLPLDRDFHLRVAEGLVAAALGQPAALSMSDSLHITEIALAAREAADAIL